MVGGGSIVVVKSFFFITRFAVVNVKSVPITCLPQILALFTIHETLACPPTPVPAWNLDCNSMSFHASLINYISKESSFEGL